MTSGLSSFAARLREIIHSTGRDSWNASLREDKNFNTLALELFALQFAHNAAYRRICQARGISPGTIRNWPQIPAVPTTAFKELELTSLPAELRARVFHSSGTTQQQPSRHFHSELSLGLYEASLWPWFARHVLTDGQSPIADSPLAAVWSQVGEPERGRSCPLPKPAPVADRNVRAPSPGSAAGHAVPAIDDWRLAILTPSSTQAPHSSLVHMFETVRRRSGAPESAFLGRVAPDGAWTLNFEAALAQLTADSGLRTVGSRLLLLGTAFSFVHLLDFLVERDLRFELPSGSRVMETGGYKGRSRSLPKAELHALITERLGVPLARIVCEYGMSELSSQAYDRVTGDKWQVTRGKWDESCNPLPVTCHFHFPPWARAQVISPETDREVAEGEPGLIRVFDLANVFSVMAIQTEDLGIRRGDGFELIGRAELAEPRGCSLMAV